MRSRVVWGVLVLVTLVAAVGVVSVVARSDDDEVRGSQLQTGSGYDRQVAADLARRCHWNHQDPGFEVPDEERGYSQDDLERDFVRVTPSGESRYLLAEASELYAGEEFEIAPGAPPVGEAVIPYGPVTQLEEIDSQKLLEGSYRAGPEVLFGGRGAAVCVTAVVPAGTEPGDYRVVLQTDDGPLSGQISVVPR